MNSLADFVIAEFWRYTVLTFRILFWIFRFGVGVISGVLNARNNQPNE